ncbi:MAG: hypothetical protein FWE33_07730 [Defluviitaleaceae bacterium]|nr:hypothetical protein [Defluviitaleaceae bacterium]
MLELPPHTESSSPNRQNPASNPHIQLSSPTLLNSTLQTTELESEALHGQAIPYRQTAPYEQTASLHPPDATKADTNDDEKRKNILDGLGMFNSS